MPSRVSRCLLLLTLFMFLLALPLVVDLDGIATRSTTVVLEPEKEGMLLAGTPHDRIVIDGDADFTDTALLEGWPGDGSPENPFIIDGLDIDIGGGSGYGHCIWIRNTRVSFVISNCNVTGASSIWVYLIGIYLENVTHCKLVNNTCNNNGDGISLHNSPYNIITNNTCNSNKVGIFLELSESNTIIGNTCFSNSRSGISLSATRNNIVTDNICTSNDHGISLDDSDFNTVANNTCNSNRIGVYLWYSAWNTVVKNTCLNNTEHDIYLYNSDSNTVANNITYSGLLQLGGILFLLILGAVTLVSVRHWFRKRNGDQDDIIVPIRYRLASWFRRRRSLKHADVDEPLESDSSSQ